MNKKLISEDFKNDLERMMGIPIKKISEDELNKIKRIKLSYKRIDGTPKNYDFNDLTYLKNLKLIVFDHFIFNDSDIEKIEQVSSLAYIHFDSCEFKINHFDFNENVNFVMFDNCRSLDVSMFDNIKVESLKIVGSSLYPKEVDLMNMQYSEKLREISINNYNIKNAYHLLSVAPNINSLNFDGSIVDDYSRLCNTDIKLSYRDKYLDGMVN